MGQAESSPPKMILIFLLGVSTSLVFADNEVESFEEDKYGVKYASDCEVCKVAATEFAAKLSESEKTHAVLETGYSHTKDKKKTKYVTSELRLIETMEGICDRILAYNIHKERKDSTRFAKGQSETFQTLEGLVAKGVKVDIGIPHELWNKPSAEVTQLKTQCESLIEKHEEDIEDWYFNHQDKYSFTEYVCSMKALNGEDSCLSEKVKKKKKKSKSKGETGSRDEL